MKTNVSNFIEECSCGLLEEKLGLALSEAGLAQILHGQKKKAKVCLEFTFDQIGDDDSEQVVISQKLSKTVPTKRGKKYEDDSSDTVFYVAKGGKLSLDRPTDEPPKLTKVSNINVK